MAFIVKCYPPTLNAQNEFDVELKIFDGSNPQSGDEVFVWEAERRSRSGQSGGRGLAMRGTIRSSSIRHDRATLRIYVDQPQPNRALTITDLEPYRDQKSAAAMPKLARKLYRHSHTKIADLDNDEAELLLSHFAADEARSH